MSLSSILSIAQSGLTTAQTGINVVSDNVTNVNTPGYVRKVANQQSVVLGGQGVGVDIAGISRAADAYLEQANRNATADSNNSAALASVLNNAQTLFGDPSSSTSFFAGLDNVFSAFSSASAAPSNSSTSQALNSVTSFFQSAGGLSNTLATIARQTDSQISADVATVNTLLSQIDSLNQTISRGSIAGQDVSGAQNQQGQLIDQLSQYMNINVAATAHGAVVVRGADGSPLAGDGEGPASFSYDTTGPQGQLIYSSPYGSTQPYSSRLQSGELNGLLTARNSEIPQLRQQLAELTTQAAGVINAAANAHTPTPAPATLVGKDTGVDIPTVVGDFSGSTSLVVLNSGGVIQGQVNITFTGGGYTINGGAVQPAANFVADVNTALGALGGSASSTGNVLTLNAGGANGLAIVDGSPAAQNGGKGFSQYFGFNDVVRSSVVADYNTGLKATDLSGFNAGAFTLRVSGANGAKVQDITITPTAGGTVGGLLTQLNSTTTGFGLYGQFSLTANGAVVFTPNANSGYSVDPLSDTTQRNGTGASATAFFGIGAQNRGARASGFSVNPALLQNPNLLAVGTVNTAAVPPAASLPAGDTSGLDAISQAGKALTSFLPAGSSPAQTLSVSDYAAALAARIGDKAKAAESAKTSAAATAQTAKTRLTASEGVNIDEELVNLTTYQQAYNASSRLIIAARDMFDTLLGMVR
jgi:flagellar hook-associated protein 1 FlgK